MRGQLPYSYHRLLYSPIAIEPGSVAAWGTSAHGVRVANAPLEALWLVKRHPSVAKADSLHPSVRQG
jgi:hypothetical protein